MSLFVVECIIKKLGMQFKWEFCENMSTPKSINEENVLLLWKLQNLIVETNIWHFKVRTFQDKLLNPSIGRIMALLYLKFDSCMQNIWKWEASFRNLFLDSNPSFVLPTEQSWHNLLSRQYLKIPWLAVSTGSHPWQEYITPVSFPGKILRSYT